MIIPLESVFDAILDIKNGRIKKLLYKITYFAKIMELLCHINLDPQDQQNIEDLVSISNFRLFKSQQFIINRICSGEIAKIRVHIFRAYKRKNLH